jgi:hypothetical protein
MDKRSQCIKCFNYSKTAPSIQNPIKTCCQKSLNCYFNTCCFCSDKRTQNFTDIYFDGIGALRLNNEEFNIPKELYYCYQCFPTYQRAIILNRIQKKLSYLPKDRLKQLLF